MKQDDDSAADARETIRVPSTLGGAIRQGRKNLELSQRALAARMTELGVPMDSTSITRLENDQREPRLSEGIALSRFLGFDLFLYAPKGFSYAGLVARAVSSYSAAAESVSILILETISALGMQNYLESEDPLPRADVLKNLLDEIRSHTEIDGVLMVDGRVIEGLLDTGRDWEREGAIEVLMHLLEKMGVHNQP